MMSGGMGAESILLVEDDGTINSLAVMILQRAGYSVQSCHTSEQAMTCAAIHPPSLLLSDVTLPGPIDGIALARRMRVMLPFLPVILMSGAFDDHSLPVKGIEDAALLSKPFRRDALLSVIRNSLVFSSG